MGACGCGMAYQLLSVQDWCGRQHNCTNCRRPIDLFKTLGITQDTPHSQYAEKFAALPIRPRLSGKPEQRFVDTWDASKAGEVTYEMYRGG